MFEDSDDFYSTLKIKEIRIEILETAAGGFSGNQYLGFSTPIGLNTILGFVDSEGNTTTQIYEEELS